MATKIVTPTTHVIFDNGGTICDFFQMVGQVFERIGNKNGKSLPKVAECDTLEGLVEDFLAITKLDSSLKEEICKEVKETTFHRITEGLPMISGVHKLIKHLYEHNIPMAIASNADQFFNTLLLNNTIGLNQDLFSHCICGADDPEVKNNKPAPDVYLVCFKSFKNPPQSLDCCVIFEDSIRGNTGAVSTGMKTVFINEYKRPKETIERIADKITVIIDSFNDFKPESVGLPHYPIE